MQRQEEEDLDYFLSPQQAPHGVSPSELRARRQGMRLSQADLGRLLSVSTNSVARWERGELAIQNPGMLRLALDQLEQLSQPGKSSDQIVVAPQSHGRQALHTRPCGFAHGLRRHHLPAQPGRLIGREHELEAVRQHLLRDEGCLVTLVGPAGTGKTCLALEVARSLQPALRHGVIWVDLSPICDVDLVLPSIAQALGVHEHPGGRPLVENLHRSLGTRKLLLVLDNCEQLRGIATIVADLLASCPALKLLATSRRPLCIHWEHEYPIPPLRLPNPATASSPEALAAVPAVALFLERARAVDPGFALDGTNGPVVAQICARLDGLPLAIELAAAHVRLLPPLALLQELERPLELLAAGPHALPARHRSLRAALDWSYDLLSPEERRLFRQLSVFAGGFSMAAAQAMVALPALQTLSSLVEKGLAQRLPSEGLEARFRLLETVRAYAWEKLTVLGEAEDTSARHAAYHLTLAERLAPQLRGSGQLYSLAQMEREHDNFREALRWYARRKEAEPLLRLCAALWEYWFIRGHLTEGQGWLEKALSLDIGGSALVARAVALNGVGGMATLRGSLQQASRWLRESEELWRTIGDPRGLARVLADQATLLQAGVDDCDAARRVDESITLARAAGASWELGYALFSVGPLLRSMSGDDAAMASLEESLSLLEQVGDSRGAAYARMRLAEILADQGASGDAAEHAVRSLALFHPLGETWGLIMSLVVLGRVAASLGHFDRTALLFGAVEALCASAGAVLPPQSSASVEYTLKTARSRLGERAVARLFAHGGALPFRTIEAALAQEWKPTASTLQHLSDPLQLTSREREVAMLVAQGLTNREIAERLVISRRTAEGHVERIRDKLGVPSRSALAAWVAGQLLG